MQVSFDSGKEIIKPKILLHACCAVCLAYPIKLLKELYEPIVYFYNPNIFPIEEYDRRKFELIRYCEKMGYQYIIENSDSKSWYDFVRGYENEPEKGQRCNKCFEFRLSKTAEKAKTIGIKYFTTTLTVSPHKISKNIFDVGLKVANLSNSLESKLLNINEELNNELSNFVEFVSMDFKKQNGFLKTMEIAKENNFYRQKYCGCEYSIRTTVENT